MPPTVVDIHPHIIAPDTDRYPPAPLGGKQSDWSKKRPASFEDLVAQLDEAGVAKAAIVHSSTVYGYDNSYVADSVATATDRFAGVFSVDVRAADVVETLNRWTSRPGMVGLRLFTTGSTLPGQSVPVDDPATYDAWAYAQSHRVPVCVQMTYAAIPELRALLARFPDVTVILDHAANPPLDGGAPYAAAADLLTLVEYPNLFVKLTPTAFRRAAQAASTPAAFVEHLVEHFGSDRLAWGSNYPNAVGTMTQLLDAARAATSTLDPKDQANILGHTALRLYPSLEG
jgi:predicted TIM-barrel fold metal-dependent hydrolase